MGMWSQKDKEAFAKGARGEATPAPAAPATDKIPLGEENDIDEGVKKMQSANAADPTLQQRLNSVAAARAKFYGEK